MSRNLLLSGGPIHDFAGSSAALVQLLDSDGVETVVVDEPAHAAALLRDGDGDGAGGFSTVTVNALRWSMPDARHAHLRHHALTVAPDDLAAVDGFVRSGGGMLALHAAVICFDGDPVWRELCGASWDWTASTHPPLGPVHVSATPAGRAHPVTGGVADFVVTDELYSDLDAVEDLVPLLDGSQQGRTQPVLWAREVGRGRVVTDLLGHDDASLRHPAHREVLARAVAWAGGRSATPSASAEGGPP